MSPRSPEAERRRRLVTRALPFSVLALVAFVIGATVGSSDSPEKESAERFTQAWEHGEFAAMYRELNRGSQRKIELNDFVIAYREAAEVATSRSLEADAPDDPSSIAVPDSESGAGKLTVVPVPIAVTTVAFGRVESVLELPFAEGGIAWSKSLTFPGVEITEHLESQIELAPRAPILAAGGSPLAEGPAEARAHPLGSSSIDVTGEVGMAEEEEEAALARQGFPPGTPVGVSGLERAFNARLAGKPGGSKRRRSTPNGYAGCSCLPFERETEQPGVPSERGRSLGAAPNATPF